jgi:hypothetical protein
VALQPAAQLAERVELGVLDGAGRLQARVEEGRGVALREDQVVARRIVGPVHVEPQVPVQQDGHQLGGGHRRGRVARPGGGARANRVDPQLLGQLVAKVVAIHPLVIPVH